MRFICAILGGLGIGIAMLGLVSLMWGTLVLSEGILERLESKGIPAPFVITFVISFVVGTIALILASP